jgi:ribosomal-protein-alanine N-acetyltransferase
MRFAFRPITAADAKVIASWRYPPPYDFYNWDRETDPAEMLGPLAGCVVSQDEHGEVVGYACFGTSGQVPGGRKVNLYDEDLLDVGLGLRPDLTGHGLGVPFLEAILAYGQDRHHPSGYRLSVASFNERAIRAYEKVGFVRGESFLNALHGVDTEFLLMRRTNTKPVESKSDSKT